MRFPRTKPRVDVGSPYVLLALMLSFAQFAATSAFHSGSFLFFPSWRSVSSGDWHNLPQRRSSLGAADLSTALEWLAKERDGEENGPVSRIRWFNPCIEKDEIGHADSTLLKCTSLETPMPASSNRRMPLYPLGACYLPSSSHHVINNVERRNIQMMKDLIVEGETSIEQGRFCVTLRASDTGNLASVGTVMRILKTDEQVGYDGEISRVLVTCIPEERVEIVHVENSAAWSDKTGKIGSDEYLVAQVCSKCDPPLVDDKLLSHENKETLSKVAADYDAARSYYIEPNGVGRKELPPFAIGAMMSMANLTAATFGDPHKGFWDAAETWQTLCNTVREARRIDLQCTVNEIMVSEAIKKGGPLNLPIRRETLAESVQIKLRGVEEQAAKDFMNVGLDPCLDFQAILSSSSHFERINLLSRMISMERRRLEAKSNLVSLFGDQIR